jgi:hypothetical protein
VKGMDVDAALRRSNFLMDRLAGAFRKPDRARREAALDRIEADLKAMAKDRQAGPLAGETNGEAAGRGVAEVLLGLLTPAVRRIQSGGDRTEQGARNLEVALALAAFHRDNGRYPKALAEVAPKYLEKLPGDLFIGAQVINARGRGRRDPWKKLSSKSWLRPARASSRWAAAANSATVRGAKFGSRPHFSHVQSCSAGISSDPYAGSHSSHSSPALSRSRSRIGSPLCGPPRPTPPPLARRRPGAARSGTGPSARC